MLCHAPVLDLEQVPLGDAKGRMLRRSLTADRDQPPFNRAAMDGFAVRSGEFEQDSEFTIVGTVVAGGVHHETVPPSTALRIATGAALPADLNAVIPIEKAQVDDSVDPPRVSFKCEPPPAWMHVHRRGSDAKQHQAVLEAPCRLDPHHLAIAATVGQVELTVSTLPRICLLTTGDEVKPADTPADQLQDQHIRNSNGPMLAAVLSALGAPPLDHVHVIDEPQQVLTAAREALSRSHLVLTAGGISAGDRDLLPWVWRELGLRTLAHGVAIQPGRPLLAAVPGSAEAPGNCLVIGLPGNPISVLATAHLFLWPLLETMLSGKEAALPWRPLKLAEPVRPNPRRELFRTVRLLKNDTARAIQWHGSGDLMHVAAADGWIRLPIQSDPVAAGSTLPMLPMIRAGGLP